MKIDINDLPDNKNILKTVLTISNKFNSGLYENIAVSISGGSDSDIMLDLIMRIVTPANLPNVKFVFFNTGLEYKATLRHLDYLENKYSCNIIRKKPVSIPKVVKECGQPIFSKYTADKLSCMQRHNMEFKYFATEEAIEKYGRVKDVSKWWNNEWSSHPKSPFNINKRKKLKSFLIDNPPDFKVSDKCCHYTKKLPIKMFYEEHDIDLAVTGIRMAEGGIRSVSYGGSCFTDKSIRHNYATYRPLFFWTDMDKLEYKKYFNIKYSDCYEVYGFTRTGCAGCPFNLKLNEDLDKMKIYEPDLYKACNNVFGDAYKYTKKYNDYSMK
ncbi:hypothetical protein AN643_00435 [Candidatus Epulonipiscioides saccharophilum]|nr:hypothetical protein AN644_04530 [Epulopiscium sp. SCG-C06WGA-EpuloA1]ONI47747.1 hypothetical protein AN643_00435 [Epulopiscium sp. SCG-B10WGA-EpuloB]